MSAEQLSPPDSPPAPNAGPTFEVVPNGPEGPFFNLRELFGDTAIYYGIAPTPTLGPWPEYPYNFSENQLLGNDIVEPSRASRLRAVIDVLTADPANMAAFQTADQSYAQSIKDVEAFLRKTSKVNGQDVAYETLFPIDGVLGIIELAWGQGNDPVHSVLLNVAQKYREQIPTNDFAQLIRDVMFATNRNLIIEMYVTHKRGLLAAQKLALQEPIVDN